MRIAYRHLYHSRHPVYLSWLIKDEDVPKDKAKDMHKDMHKDVVKGMFNGERQRQRKWRRW